MAITPHATWTTEADKATSRPVYLANLEYDYLRAGVTYQSDFKASGYSGDADLDTKPGKVILKTSSTDIMSESSYGTTTFPLTARLSDSYYFNGCLIRVDKKIDLYGFTYNCKSTTSGSVTTIRTFRKCKTELNDKIKTITIDSDEYVDSDGNSIFTSNVVGGQRNPYKTITTSYSDYQVTGGSFPMVSLDPGDYAFIILFSYPTSGDGIEFKTWEPLNDVFNTSGALEGFKSGPVQIGEIYLSTPYNGFDGGGTGGVYSGNVTTFSILSGSFNGSSIFKEFSVGAYANSTYTTPWMRVKNSSGTGTTPSTAGQLRLNYTKPLNTDITFAFYGDADGSDAGQVTIDSTAFDGDSVTSYYDYYKLVCTMTTTDWFSTPEISSLEVYFKQTYDYCKFDDTFVMADGSPARPYIDSIPSYETRVDPINNKVSFNEPAIDLLIQRKGLSKTQSDIESLIQNYWMTGRELSLKVGFNGVSSSNFIAYQTGVTNNQIWDGDNVYRLECKDPYFQTKDPFLIDQAETFQPYFNYANPIDIMLTLISLSGIPQRLIDTTSFSTIKSTYFSSWQFYRPFPEPIKDIKKELDEIALLTGAVAVTKEDGKIYCVKLDAGGTIIKKSADTYTFTDQNSKEYGKAQIDLSKRVNVCSVQRGYWVEPSDKESEDVEYWDTEIDEESILNVGRSEVLKIENKWIPKDVQIAGVYQSALVAQRLTSRFRYGLWTLKRQTDLSFAFIQVGDPVSILGSQILYKNFYGENYVRGVVIGKEVRPSAGEYEGEIIFTIWIYENISAGLEPEPTAQGTSLAFSSVTSSQIVLDWTDASPAPDGYVALFATGTYPNTLPEDGVQYTAADVVNDATVAYRNTTSGFTHSSLSADTQYFYKIFSYNDTGGTASTTNYLKVAPLMGSQWTNATEPGNSATSFVFGTFADETNSTVSWTAPAGSPAAQLYLITRSATADPTWTPTDLTGYTVGDNPTGDTTIRYIGSAVTFTDTEINYNGATTYYYRCYPFRGSNAASYNYKTSSPLSGNKTPPLGEPTMQPEDLSAESTTAAQIDVSWSAPSTAPTDYIVLYKKSTTLTDVPVDTNTYTTASTIGTSSVGYVGGLTSCSITGLSSGSTYIIKVFSFNESGAGTENYLTVSAPSITCVAS